MANKTIGALTAASSLALGDKIELEQGGVSSTHATLTQVKALVLLNLAVDYATAAQGVKADAAQVGIQYKDESVSVGTLGTATSVNFTGAGVTASVVGAAITVNVPGAAATVIPIIIACSDEVTAITAGVAKVTFRMPFAFTLTGVRASLTTAQTSGTIFTVDINEAGLTLLSTKITIDNTEKTSVTAVTPPVMSDTALADDAEITIDVDLVGDGTAKGLKVTLLGTKV